MAVSDIECPQQKLACASNHALCDRLIAVVEAGEHAAADARQRARIRHRQIDLIEAINPNGVRVV